MHQTSLTRLEYPKILDRLASHAVSARAKARIHALTPCESLAEVERFREETTQARAMLEVGGTPPLAVMESVDRILPNLGKGQVLTPDELGDILQFLTTCRRMKGYLTRFQSASQALSAYGDSIDPCPDLADEIERCIRAGQVDDRASGELRDIRRQIDILGERVKGKLESLLRGHPEYFMESFVSMRNGRWTLPVRREAKKNIQGQVVDASASGGTVFIEPTAVARMQEELSLLHIREMNEVQRILYQLTGQAEACARPMSIDCEAMEILDFLFARARLSLCMGAIPARMTKARRIDIRDGRHPLLDPETAVPLNLRMGGDGPDGVSAVVVTGPNTGGKTVALKTIGLLTLMAQTGLHVPCAQGSHFRFCADVLCDLGDGQSIEQNLSTFSSHIVNIQSLLERSGEGALVLLDELGAGTDPMEGMGLAVALLERFHRSGCMLVATTHYPEIKAFARDTPGFVNARMLFDRDTLRPLYRLEVGAAGESCALLIALRLGLDPEIVARAHRVSYGGEIGDAGGLEADMGADGMRASEAGGMRPAGAGGPEPSAGVRSLRENAGGTGDGRAARNAADPAAPGADAQVGPSADAHSSPCASAHSTPGASAPSTPDTAPEAPPPPPKPRAYAPGDSVWISSLRRSGIVATAADARGEVAVVVGEKRLNINHKRLQPFIPRDELYPGDYDLSIVLDTVENRKTRHEMERKLVPGKAVVIRPERT